MNILTSFIQRERSKKASEHLTAMLSTIRKVNQLIVKEKNIDRLLNRICENFINTGGSDIAWIVLLDEFGEIMKIAAAALDNDLLPIEYRLKQDKLPDCGQRALRQSAVVVTKESSSTCTGCSLVKSCCDKGVLTVRLGHNGKVYGLLSATMPAKFLAKPQEHYLFKDVAGDIAFALHSMEMEQEHKQMQEQLIVADRLASVGELAAGIAHELNNPLTGILGLSQLLAARDLPEETKKDLKLVYSEAQRAAGIVKNMLAFAREHPPVKEQLSINDVISKILELLAYEQKVNNIKVVKHLAPDLPQIMGDYFQLQQVFLNIVINAEQIMTEAHGKGTLIITTRGAGDIVTASFMDDGPGISQATLRRIYDPFFTTKEVGKGTGLGLSICHGIISNHGGRIYTKSELGKGATFTVELPLSKQKQ